MRTLTALLVTVLFALPLAAQTGVKIRDLPVDPTPAGTDMFPETKLAGGTYTQTRDTLRSGLLSTTAAQSANTCLAGPTTGSAAAPTFRALVAADIPNLWTASQSANLVWASPGGGAGVPTFRALVAADIGAALIAYSKIQNVSASPRLLGRSTAGAGVIEELTVGTGLTLSAGVIASSTGGTVTSVAATVPSWLSVAGSPVNTIGTLAFSAAGSQTTGKVLGTCAGATSFTPCSLTAAELPGTVSATGGNTVSNSTASVSSTTWTEDDASPTGPTLTLLKSRGGGSAAINDLAGVLNFQIRNSAGSAANIGILDATADNVTATTEGGHVRLRVKGAGAFVAEQTWNTDGTVSIPTQLTVGVAGLKSHIVCAGTAPTISCTGTGAGGSSAVEPGSNDCASTITMTTGTAPSATGTCMLTFANAYVTNMPVCITQLVSGAASWNTVAPQPMITTQSLTAPQITWNNTLSLTASTTYKISVACFGK